MPYPEKRADDAYGEVLNQIFRLSVIASLFQGHASNYVHSVARGRNVAFTVPHLQAMGHS